jgi:hypothetical protein
MGIHASRYLLQMVWVYAGLIFAKVVNLESAANGLFGQLVRHPVGFFGLSIEAENPITLCVSVAIPNPAGIFLFYFRPKSIGYFHKPGHNK